MPEADSSTPAVAATTATVTVTVDAGPRTVFLPARPAEAHAVVSVTVRGLGTGQAARRAAEVVILDCSGSMSSPRSKFDAARRAAAAALRALRDGTHFALVAGHDTARVAYPYHADGSPAAGPDGTPGGGSPGGCDGGGYGSRMAVADEETRETAAYTAARLGAIGGTAIASWLDLARDLLAQHPGAGRHALLLTDGRSEHDGPGELDRILADCSGVFTCDARGIGDGWDSAELKRITSRLQGTADAVADLSLLEAEFRAMAEAAMGQVLDGLRIRVTPAGRATVRYVKQVHPAELELPGRPAPDGSGALEYSTRAWGDETREYLLCLATAPDGGPGDAPDVPRQLAHVELILDGDGDGDGERDGGGGHGGPGGGRLRAPRLPPPVPLSVRWTDDPALSDVIDPRVEHYHRHARLAQAVQAGCDAYDRGDRATALTEWGRGVRLARGLGDSRMLKRLRRLVTDDGEGVGDGDEGAAEGRLRVRLRQDIRPLDIMSAAVITGQTTRFGVSASDAPPDGGDGGQGLRECPACGYPATADAGFCTRCGEGLAGPGAS